MQILFLPSFELLRIKPGKELVKVMEALNFCPTPTQKPTPPPSNIPQYKTQLHPQLQCPCANQSSANCHEVLPQ